MGHAVARKLDIAGYSLDETGLREERVPKEVVMLANARLEEFVQVTYGIMPVVEDVPDMIPQLHSGTSVVFATENLSQQWLAEGYVDFLEVFCGCHEFTLRIRECGLTAGEGLDSQMISYGQVWPLHVESVRRQAAWVIAEGLRPKAVHCATPCNKESCLRHGLELTTEEREENRRLKEITIDILEHQESNGLLGSHENPT